MNKRIFDVATLCNKYRNENLDVQDSQWYYLFIFELSEGHLNLNAKTGKWNEIAEFLKFV